MQFQVPQFIEVEDKIFGPLTLKQFIYIAGGVGIIIVLFSFLHWFIAIIIAVPVGVFAGALAFFQINNKPFINIVESFFKYYIGNKLYIWQKEQKTPVAKDRKTEEDAILASQVFIPKLSDSKLKDLTWNLDVKSNSNPVTPTTKQTNFDSPEMKVMDVKNMNQ